MKHAKIDPFLERIMWDRLITIADETVNSLVRTSFSMNVRDSYDLSCVIFDEFGRSVAQGTFSLPTFTGTAPQTLERMLERFPAATLQPGDVIVTNDPWIGTGHLYDINICRPIFVGERLIGFVMSITHLPDTGGMGMSSLAREIHEEGLIIPIQKIVSAGVPNDGLFEMIRANVRVADQVIGDVNANIICTDVGARSTIEFCAEYGLSTLSEFSELVIERTDRAMKAGLDALPSGTYAHAIDIEGVDGDVHLEIRVTKSNDEVFVDFENCSAQLAYGLNCPLCYTRAVAYYALKCLLAPDLPNNAGTFSRVHVRAPEKSVLNPVWPAATGARHTIGHFVFALIMGALQKALPDRVVTEMGMMNVFNVFGTHRDGTSLATLFFLTGGFGALKGWDGRAAIPGPGNMVAISTEVWEDLSSTTIVSRRIRPDSGGVGEFTGGPGLTVEMANTTGHDLIVAFLGLRTRFAAAGMFDGGTGALRRFEIDGAPVDGKGRHVLKPGQVLTIIEAGGGGYGPAEKRPIEAILSDIDRGYVTPRFAEATYPAYRRHAAEAPVAG
ncbi:hydantoinase B/oxoprolinase family protein [Acuticoccus kandeliae]|uniref:hydantoinase B/oxoprolinase family protein n=1 Tax=Acuticoccus kandeliae TaxID=2073160 RepID=UPI000D3E318F|nr:hydantoinase B/oxoprolinase family protein [Acuticoccus kandeliae]